MATKVIIGDRQYYERKKSLILSTILKSKHFIMNTDSLHFLALENKISSFESLIASQQTKIDSLALIVHDTKIAEGHFSSVLGSQTGIFSVIIAVLVAGIGLISWNFIKREVHKLENKTDQKIEDITTRVKISLQQIEYQGFYLLESLAHLSDMEGKMRSAFIWSMRACTSIYIKNDLKKINHHIIIAEIYSNSIDKEDIKQHHLDEVNEIIQKLSKIEGVDQEKLNNIKNTLNALYYSPK